MMKTRLALVAGLAAVLTVFTTSAAFAYPDPQINPTGGSGADGVVTPGDPFTVTGDFGGTDCNPWTSAFNGTAGASGTGTTFSVTYTAPITTGRYTLDLTCTWSDGTVSGPSTAQTTTVSFPIQVASGDAPREATASPDRGLLPNIGGTSPWFLYGGLALASAGCGIIAVRRKTY